VTKSAKQKSWAKKNPQRAEVKKTQRRGLPRPKASPRKITKRVTNLARGAPRRAGAEAATGVAVAADETEAAIGTVGAIVAKGAGTGTATADGTEAAIGTVGAIVAMTGVTGVTTAVTTTGATIVTIGMTGVAGGRGAVRRVAGVLRGSLGKGRRQPLRLQRKRKPKWRPWQQQCTRGV